MTDSLPVKADPVLDGELVDDTLPQPRPRVRKRNRFVLWWLHSPRVPLWLKSKPQARQALKDAVTWLVLSPLRFLGAVVRGVVVGARWWRGWVTVRDYRTAAEESEKLADKFTEIRAQDARPGRPDVPGVEGHAGDVPRQGAGHADYGDLHR
ncbi:S-DNA-T family DNA segregation ATPase FtsK/SpoIIIE [Amycolatopsis sulphurea]|uniref:S-DNA-T family DNA segregation ATPase FtsK/SpoIIIE n=1 Tax=Amycolatopsis sulphurea TaxID=76022 RepID=A0A2A9G0V3_9PSEU|nr:S-DNA-T family DNA segregation ATPase FtsK/SpoIIIE [Amycolatopsis sulphurea]